jgi:hypothetical protein
MIARIRASVTYACYATAQSPDTGYRAHDVLKESNDRKGYGLQTYMTHGKDSCWIVTLASMSGLRVIRPKPTLTGGNPDYIVRPLGLPAP